MVLCGVRAKTAGQGGGTRLVPKTDSGADRLIYKTAFVYVAAEIAIAQGTHAMAIIMAVARHQRISRLDFWEQRHTGGCWGSQRMGPIYRSRRRPAEARPSPPRQASRSQTRLLLMNAWMDGWMNASLRYDRPDHCASKTTFSGSGPCHRVVRLLPVPRTAPLYRLGLVHSTRIVLQRSAPLATRSPASCPRTGPRRAMPRATSPRPACLCCSAATLSHPLFPSPAAPRLLLPNYIASSCNRPSLCLSTFVA